MAANELDPLDPYADDEERISAPAEFTAVYNRRTDTLAASFLVNTERGPYRLGLSLPLAPLRQRVIATLAQRAPVGFDFGDVAKLARKVAKDVGVDKLARKALDISTQLAPVTPAIMAVVPALGITLKAAQLAAKLVDGARKGNPAAQKKMVEIVERAHDGDPAAVKASRALQVIYRIHKHGPEYRPPDMSSEVAGWLWNVPYRSNLAALELDPSNPRHAMRALYLGGVNRILMRRLAGRPAIVSGAMRSDAGFHHRPGAMRR